MKAGKDRVTDILEQMLGKYKSFYVLQGHTEAVTCAAFSRSEHIISGSDDRTVKVWDLRNMRAPLTNIQTDSQVAETSLSLPHYHTQSVLNDL
jgi:WD40 repeat protein